MADSSFREVLAPLAARLRRPVSEREIIRVGAAVASGTSDAARREIIKWAQRRSGGRLPSEAWAGEGFEYFAAGRNSAGVRVVGNDSDIWAIRVDDPDKEVAGRTWTTEVVIGSSGDGTAKFSARLSIGGPETDLPVEPHTPGFVQQLAELCGLSVDGVRLRATPWLVDDAEEVDRLVDFLLDPARVLPVFVISIRGGADQSPISAEQMTRATLGLALVAVIPAAMTWSLTDRLGKSRSVYGGAIRVYMPGFTEDADPYAHRLELVDGLATPSGIQGCRRWMRSLAADYSLRRLSLGRDVLTFAEIRRADAKRKQEMLVTSGASDTDQLAAANKSIATLEVQLEEAHALQEYFAAEHQGVEERSRAAEEQLRAMRYRIHELTQRAEMNGQADTESPEDPSRWADLVSWCDINLAGKVVLGPVARRNARAPDFDDLALVMRCLKWLASTGRDMRLQGGQGSVRDEPVDDAVRNSACGGDEFEVAWEGRRHTVDWHVKSGGNTRDPRRCLRIYYFWDAPSSQIVIADMPGHRVTGAS